MNRLKNFFGKSNLLPICYISCILIFSSVIAVIKINDTLIFPVMSENLYAEKNTFENLYSLPLSARASCVVEVNTQSVIYQHNADAVLPMASTTKVMTALVAIENCNINETVTVTKESANIEGSSIYLQKDEKIPLYELLYGLMLESGNDAASAIAIHCAGSEEKFAELMNQKAKELGLSSTNFTNPHGLPDENHYTTAKELALLSAAAMQNEFFKTVVSSKSYFTQKRFFSNHNKLLRMYDGANGVKTGFTKTAGRCLVSSAERDGNTFVAVTLDAPNDWEDHKKLLDYAFENYKTVKAASPFEINISGKTYCLSNDLYYVQLKDSLDKTIRYEIKYTPKETVLYVYADNSLYFTYTLNLKSTTSPSWIT